jgi:hypothetical protein
MRQEYQMTPYNLDRSESSLANGNENTDDVVDGSEGVEQEGQVEENEMIENDAGQDEGNVQL